MVTNSLHQTLDHMKHVAHKPNKKKQNTHLNLIKTDWKLYVCICTSVAHLSTIEMGQKLNGFSYFGIERAYVLEQFRLRIHSMGFIFIFIVDIHNYCMRYVSVCAENYAIEWFASISIVCGICEKRRTMIELWQLCIVEFSKYLTSFCVWINLPFVNEINVTDCPLTNISFQLCFRIVWQKYAVR